MKIFIKSIPRQTATNVSDWKSADGKPLNKTKIGRAKDKLIANYDQKVGGLKNYISYRPWIDEKTGKQMVGDNGKELTLQDKMEQKWNKPAGYFTNRAWQRGDSLDPKDLTYYQKQTWALGDTTTVLDDSNMEDELGYYVFLDSPYVANSETEWRQHKWPKALYYIAQENESETLKYKKNEVIGQAIARLYSPQLTLEEKRKIACILDLTKSNSETTPELITNSLFKYINDSTTTPGSNIDKFTVLYEQCIDPKTTERFNARFMLKEALDRRVISERQQTYTFFSTIGSIVIGERYEEAVDFLLNPKKDKEVAEIKEKIKSK